MLMKMREIVLVFYACVQFSGITSTEVSGKVLLAILNVFISTTTFWASEQDDRHKQYRFSHKIYYRGGVVVKILPF